MGLSIEWKEKGQSQPHDRNFGTLPWTAAALGKETILYDLPVLCCSCFLMVIVTVLSLSNLHTGGACEKVWKNASNFGLLSKEDFILKQLPPQFFPCFPGSEF